MAFWSTPNLDPKRQFKFKVTFGPAGGITVPWYMAQSADRPVYTITETKLDILDKNFHFPGKINWTPIKIKFVDGATAGHNTAKNAYNYLSNAGYINPAGVDAGGNGGLGTIAKATAVIPQLTVETLNSEGVTIDTWKLNNAWVTTVALNGFDYAAEGILTAEFSFRYDWADLTATT
jgi:hypothetical protein